MTSELSNYILVTLNYSLFISHLTRLYKLELGEFPRLVSRFCSYPIAKADPFSDKPQQNIVTDWMDSAVLGLHLIKQ